MATYCSKFIPEFSDISQQLRDLTKKDCPFQWSEKHDKAFNQIKDLLMNAKVMAYFDYIWDYCQWLLLFILGFFIVWFLIDRTRNIILRKEDQRKKHLTTTFRQNGYPLRFIRAISSSIQKPSALPEEEPDEEPDDEESQKEEEKQPLAVIPYVSDVSEQIRKACEKYNLKVVFKSGPTLHSLLTKVKDPLPKEKLANVVYQIPCQCGKMYVGETQALGDAS